MYDVRGACAGEVVLNDRGNDVIDVIPVDLARNGLVNIRR